MRIKTKAVVLVEIVVVLCSVFLVAPAIAVDQTMQKVSASTSTSTSTSAITTASEDDITLDIYGNANEDDTIDMRDTTYIKLVIFKKKTETKLADANYDGKVSMLDVGQTKLIILGKEKKLTLIDLADRTVTIDKPVERIVAGAYLIEEIMIVEGGEAPYKRIVGWCKESWTANRQWKYQKWKEKLPEIEDIPDTGYPWKETFNVEKVIILKSDLVIFSTTEAQFKTILEQLEQAGIPTVCVRFGEMDKTPKSTLLLGYVLDKEERAQDIVDYYTEQIDKVYSRLDEIEGKPKPKVLILGGYRKWRAYGPDGFIGIVAVPLGVENICPETTNEISPEHILKANPDIIIVSGSYWPKRPGTCRLGYFADIDESRELLMAWIDRPGWDTLNAVKNEKVYSIHHGSPGRIYSFAVLQSFAKWFYPNEFEDMDPEESFKEFHERFMPVDYSGVWMMSLWEE